MSIKAFELVAIINNPIITPSPTWDKGNGPETRPGIEPSEAGDVIPNPALAGTLALYGEEEVRLLEEQCLQLLVKLQEISLEIFSRRLQVYL